MCLANLSSHGLLPRIHPGDALLESTRCELERGRPTFPVMDCYHESIVEMLCWKARAASWNVAGRPLQSWTATTNPSWRCSAGKRALRAGTLPADLSSHGLLPRIHSGDALLESARRELERCRPTFPVMDCYHDSIPEMPCWKAHPVWLI